MKKALLLCLGLAFIIPGCSKQEDSQPQTASKPMSGSQTKEAVGKPIAVADMAQWSFTGIGEVAVDEAEHALCLTEGDNSKGVTIMSPTTYGKTVVVTYKFKPLNPETVHVLMLSVSDKDTGGDITVPADYDGNFGFWTGGNVQNYVFALHNAAHNRKPFITINPGSSLLTEAEANVIEDRWHDIEIGRHDKHLYIKVDGKTIVEGMEPAAESLPAGNICFRLRGVPWKAASALFKDVVVK